MILKNAGFSSDACGITSRSAMRRALMTSILASGMAAHRIHSAVYSRSPRVRSHLCAL